VRLRDTAAQLELRPQGNAPSARSWPFWPAATRSRP